MNVENYSIGFIDNTTDITGVLVFLAVKYGYRREIPVPYYKRKYLNVKMQKIWRR